MRILFIISSLFVFISTLFPLLKFNHWYIRGFDFPRIQIFTIVILYMIVCIKYLKKKSLIFAVAFCIFALGLDVYRIGGYTEFADIESKSEKAKKSSFSIISLNVKQENSKYQNVLDLINDKDPDIFLALETNKKWIDALSALNKKYPSRKLAPKDNSYGMALYSKLPLYNTDVKYLVDKKIPSIFTEVKTSNDKLASLICLHPRPPRPGGASSLQRDGELVAAAKIVRKLKDRAVVVVGDLNDVAWSHTTRLFKRVSGTLDPRIGRGFFNTFPADLKLFSFPLDHVFHNENLTLVDMKVLEDVGADHLPVMATFNVSKEIGKGLKLADSEDLKEANEISNNADRWSFSEVNSE